MNVNSNKSLIKSRTSKSPLTLKDSKLTTKQYHPIKTVDRNSNNSLNQTACVQEKKTRSFSSTNVVKSHMNHTYDATSKGEHLNYKQELASINKTLARTKQYRPKLDDNSIFTNEDTSILQNNKFFNKVKTI